MSSTNVYYKRWTSVMALSWSLGVLIWTNINVLYVRKIMLKFGFYKLVSSWEELTHTFVTISISTSPWKKDLALWRKLKALILEILFAKFEYYLLSSAREEEQVYSNDNDDDYNILIKISQLTVRSKNVGRKCVLFLMKIACIIKLIISILSKSYRHTFVQSMRVW